MNQQNQDGNEPGHTGNSAPPEGNPDAASPSGLSPPAESVATTYGVGSQNSAAPQEGPGSNDQPESSDRDRKKRKTGREAESDSEMRETAEMKDIDLHHTSNRKGQNERGSGPGSGTTRPKVKAEGSEKKDGTKKRPIEITDDEDANTLDVEDYDAQRDPKYSRFGTPISTFSTKQNDQGELMYWVMHCKKKYYVVKVGSNDAPKYRMVWDQEWRGKKPDTRLENAKNPKFQELGRLDDDGKTVYTWKDVTAIRGVAWIEDNGEGLDGIDPREKIWCSWSVDGPDDDKKPVHQRLKYQNRSKGRRAQAFNYTLIFCEVQKKGSQDKVECVIDRNTYRKILRAGRSATDRKIIADITLFIHAEYAEKRHNGKIKQKSASPSRDFGEYLRECSAAPDSWEKRHQEKLDDYEKEEMDEESGISEESGDETDFYTSPSRRSSDRGSRGANSRRQKSDTSEGFGDESDSFDRGTHRTKSKRKGSPNYGRGSRSQDKDRLDEILKMLQDLSQRVQRLEDDGGKSRKSKKRS